jgi:hypothetical protein
VPLPPPSTPMRNSIMLLWMKGAVGHYIWTKPACQQVFNWYCLLFSGTRQTRRIACDKPLIKNKFIAERNGMVCGIFSKPFSANGTMVTSQTA